MRAVVILILCFASSCISRGTERRELLRELEIRTRTKDSLVKQVKAKQDSLLNDPSLAENIHFITGLTRASAELEGLELQIQTLNKVLDSLGKR